MSILKINLNEEHLKLISNIRFKKEVPEIKENDTRENISWGIDFNNLYGGSFILEDISYILGIYDQHIEGTECDYDGVKFPLALEEYMFELHFYVLEHIDCIEEILHQFVTKGGVKVGEYTCKDNERIWKYNG